MLGPAGREPPDLASTTQEYVQLPVDVDEFDQLVVAQLVQYPGDVEGGRGGTGPAGAACPQRSCPHLPLQPQLLAVQRRGGQSFAEGAREPAGDVAHRGEIGLQPHVVGRPHRRYRQRAGPPPFTPGQQQPGLAQP